MSTVLRKTNTTFEKGDRVYHNSLRKYGTFIEYDLFSGKQMCYVLFDDEDSDDPEDATYVTTSWLDSAVDENKIHLFSKRNITI